MIRHAYYCQHTDHLHLAGNSSEGGVPLPSFVDVNGLVNKALQNIYDGFEGIVEPNLFTLTNEVIGQGISQGVIEYGKPNPAFLVHMQKTGTWFSARKTYKQQQELAALLMSDDGKTKRTFRSFKAKAQTIVGEYNENWLKTEYNTAIRAARMGSRWQGFEANADLYPNLEYLPSRAANPRPEHKPYYHVIRPLNDDFWVKHYPPSDYNCQCGAEPTDAEPTELPAKGPAPAPGLDHNPGITEAVFSDTQPYTVALVEAGADLAAIDAEGEQLQRMADIALMLADGSAWSLLRKEVTSLVGQFGPADVDDLTSIRGYCGSEFIKLNAWLRGERKATPYLEAYNRLLQEALLKLPDFEGTVFRGTTLTEAQLAVYQKAAKSKKPVTHNFFTSTSTDQNKVFSGNVLYEITSKTGKRVEAISEYADKEAEVLMPAGTQLLIKSVKKGKGGKFLITAKEL